MQQRGFESRGGEDFEIAAPEIRVRIFARDHLALLGDADGALHGAARLREDRLIARPTAAADGAAAAVEKTKRNAMRA